MNEIIEPTPDEVAAPELQIDQVPEAGSDTDQMPEPDTFSADYVKQLREEAAAHRVKAKRTDEANERMVRAVAQMDGRLVNADEVTLTDAMLDGDGIADPDKVRAVIGELIAAKPYLAKRTPTTPLPMGVRQEIEPPPSLFSLVRERL